MVDLPDGYEVPLYTGLQRVQTLAGAPRKFAIGLCTLSLIAVLWGVWMALPLLALLHAVAAWGMQQDEHWFAIVLRTRGQASHYEG